MRRRKEQQRQTLLTQVTAHSWSALKEYEAACIAFADSESGTAMLYAYGNLCQARKAVLEYVAALEAEVFQSHIPHPTNLRF